MFKTMLSMLFGNGRKAKAVDPNQVNTMIDVHDTVHGSITFNGGLHIRGTVVGVFINGGPNSTVIIYPESHVKVDLIKANKVVVNGFLRNCKHLECTDLEIKSKGHVSNVKYTTVKIDQGGTINGLMQLNDVVDQGLDTEVSPRETEIVEADGRDLAVA